MSLERNIRMKPVDNNVANLLEHVWQEATGKLQHLLSVPLDTINVDKVMIVPILHFCLHYLQHKTFRFCFSHTHSPVYTIIEEP